MSIWKKEEARWTVLAGLALALTPGVAMAFEGCFQRDYSDAHLADHPAQVVDTIALQAYRQEGGARVAEMWVTTARQGHVARTGHGGQRFWQFLICWEENNTPVCGVECDGGVMEVTRLDSKGLTFRTDYMLVGEVEACGGAVDLAEAPGQAVSYRLNRVADAICDAERMKAGN